MILYTNYVVFPIEVTALRYFAHVHADNLLDVVDKKSLIFQIRSRFHGTVG